MTEEEKMKFWGELVEPIVALLGGLTIRGEFKLVEVVQSVVAKAEEAYEAGRKDENEACAAIAAWILKMPENDVCAAIRARRQE